MRKDDVRILVASHKPYWMPNDPLYVPICVGAHKNGPIAGFASDAEGDSIADKNPRYCELTALWWGWRNLDCDALGLVHYRRHFAGSGEKGVLTGPEARTLLQRAPVIVPKRRRYYIESIASHYAHTHDGAHLDSLRESVRRVSPHRLDTFDACMRSTSAHMFNMSVMRNEVLHPYCGWLFDVLEDVEGRIDLTEASAFQERCIGRLGELLLDVWLRSEDVAYVELAVRELEGRNLFKRGTSFLAAKFFGKPYDKSF
ncbi:MAG: DUF4422 domain-containing protein [Atopobiaceae bacterium]|nr:DUF4422 domain-containing protein [Atopobiaceae bacterium]